MGRPTVEGYASGVVEGLFTDLAQTQQYIPSPAPEVAYRVPDGLRQNLLFDFRAGVVTNPDDIAHTFNFFLRGDGVPGLELDLSSLYGATGLNNFTVPAAVAGIWGTMPVPVVCPVLPGQHFDLVRLQATNLPPNDTAFNFSFLDVYENKLAVQGEQLVQVCQLFNNLAPLVIEGPAADSVAQVRKLNGFSGDFQRVIAFFNADSTTHTLTSTLFTPTGSRVIMQADVLTNTLFAAFSFLNLPKGYRLEITDATPVTTRSPYAIGSYTDFV